jgi:hypothetical protein
MARFKKHAYVHQYGPLLVTVESVSGEYYATVKRLSDGYEAAVVGLGELDRITAARGAILTLHDSFVSDRTPKTEYEKNIRRIANELGPDLEEAYGEMEATSDADPGSWQGHELGKKKAGGSSGKNEDIQKILKNHEYIEGVAWRMYDRGESVSITKVYHEIKSDLKLPGAYDFDLGDAIKSILRDANWRLE